VKTIVEVVRDGTRYEWEGDLPYIPENTLFFGYGPLPAAMRVRTQHIVLGPNGTSTQRLVCG